MKLKTLPVLVAERWSFASTAQALSDHGVIGQTTVSFIGAVPLSLPRWASNGLHICMYFAGVSVLDDQFVGFLLPI